MTPKPPSALFRAAFYVEHNLEALSFRLRRKLGLASPLRILPYRGYGTARRALVKARVLEDHRTKEARRAPVHERQSLRGSVIASWRRYVTVEIPGARVGVRWGHKQWEGVTDEEGFLDLWVEPPEGAAPGWHNVELSLLSHSDQGRARVEAPVLLSGDEAEIGVISDLDDTVIATEVTNVLKRAWALFLTENRVRLPFEGVDAFYLALQQGSTGAGHNPIFYVSSSPWNLYEHLDEYLAHHRIPAGPLLLRDWGLSRTGFAPGGGHSHKLIKIRSILDAMAPLPFILIGDSGQEDAVHYQSIVHEYPGRIRCVYIRNVRLRPGHDRTQYLERIAEDIRAHGSDMLAVDDTVTAARHAAEKGYIRREEVPEVRARKIEDMESTSVLDKLDREPG